MPGNDQRLLIILKHLVASDTRNEVTSAAARLTLAAGARLTRLALDAGGDGTRYGNPGAVGAADGAAGGARRLKSAADMERALHRDTHVENLRDRSCYQPLAAPPCDA